MAGNRTRPLCFPRGGSSDCRQSGLTIEGRGGGGGASGPWASGFTTRGASCSRDSGLDRQRDIESPVDILVDTVARMQQDLSRLQEEGRLLRTPVIPQVVQPPPPPPPPPRRAAFTSTKVPRWEQYRRVFDAIVRSNGWNNDTAALQLFSHLEGDVAHLVPLSRRLSGSGLVDALTAHNGSPGRLADYRRQFEWTTRTAGEDPAIFAT